MGRVVWFGFGISLSGGAALGIIALAVGSAAIASAYAGYQYGQGNITVKIV